MKAIRVTLSGEPTPGDCVMLHYCAVGGGRTSAGHDVVEGDTLETITAGLLRSARNYFLGESEAQLRGGNTLMIVSTADGEFVPEVLGAGTEKLAVEVL